MVTLFVCQKSPTYDKLNSPSLNRLQFIDISLCVSSLMQRCLLSAAYISKLV